MASLLIAMALTALIVGLVGQGTNQDGRERAHLQRAYYNEDGTYNRASMPGKGKPSLTFIILIIAALFFAILYRAGSIATQPLG